MKPTLILPTDTIFLPFHLFLTMSCSHFHCCKQNGLFLKSSSNQVSLLLISTNHFPGQQIPCVCYNILVMLYFLLINTDVWNSTHSQDPHSHDFHILIMSYPDLCLSQTEGHASLHMAIPNLHSINYFHVLPS